jgi:hypothetical protein
MTTDDESTLRGTDMLTALGASGIAVPPLGDLQLSAIETFEPWSWGTRHFDEEEVLYMFRTGVVADAIADEGPFFALCHAGHGMNSYALNLVTRRGPVAAFVQHGWGGVYMDSLQATFRINQTYARLHALFDNVAEPAAEVRWILMYSRSRYVRGVLDVVKYRSTGSLDEAFTSFWDDEDGPAQGEVRIFEFLAEQPGLLTSGQVKGWGFPPRPSKNPALDGQPPHVHQLANHERLELVARAQSIAVTAERGQVDKLSVGDIYHAASVAARFDPSKATVECCAAWLHDVIEGTTIEAERLGLAGVHPEVIEVVLLLTARADQGDGYYEAIKAHPAARRVKLADLDYRTDPESMGRLSEAVRAELRTEYEHAYKLLGAQWPDENERASHEHHEYGDPRLYSLDALAGLRGTEDFAASADKTLLDPAPDETSPTAETEHLAWLYASRYLPSWPDLVLTWMDWHGGVPHLVLHLDPFSASIHFDQNDRPLWVGPTGEEKRVDWDDVHETGGFVSPPAFDPYAAWGPAEEGLVTTARSQVYALITAFAAHGVDGGRVSIRPAKLLAAEGEPSVYQLLDEFPTLALTVSWYSDLISVEYRRRQREGKVAYWHEPLWLVTCEGVALAVVDEAGRVHTRGQMWDVGELIRSQGGEHPAAELLMQPVAVRVEAVATPATQSKPTATPTKNSTLTPEGRLELAGWVKELAPNEIFVFGSNHDGRHGGGAARIAHQKFGAVWGEAHGLHGRSWAIDTMTDMQTMEADIDDFLEFAAEHGELTFLVTEVGCGIGPYRPEDVAPLFRDASLNVALPASFLAVIRSIEGPAE